MSFRETFFISCSSLFVFLILSKSTRLSNHGSKFYFPCGNLSHPCNSLTLTLCALITLCCRTFAVSVQLKILHVSLLIQFMLNETFRNSGLSYLRSFEYFYLNPVCRFNLHNISVRTSYTRHSET